MKFIKAVAVTLCLCLLFLSGCTKKENTSSVPSPLISDVQNNHQKQFSLLYFTGDSINPYTATTLVNRQLSLLLYDSLVRLSPEFQPEYILAESIETTGKEASVTVKSALFSDGSAVTAEDVVYSYDLAKASDTSYASELSDIVSFKADGDKKIIITSKKADPYIANILTFPIIKKGTDKLTDQNKIVLPPIGSGRYIPDFANLKLNANNNHISGVPSIPTIYLINTPDSEVANYNLESGNVSIFSTDMSDGVVPAFTGTHYTFSLNNVIYLGLNFNNAKLKDESFRYALSAAIDRSNVCDNAYHGYANPANGIYPSVWEDAKGIQSLPSYADTKIIVAYLEELGYNSKDEEGFVVNSKGKRFSLSLVYYDGNERRAAASRIISEQLRAVGIEIILKPQSWNEYVSSLENGWFDLYIAEVKLKGHMDISELVTPGGSLSYGIPKPDTLDSTEDESQSDTDETETGKETWLTASAVKDFYNEKLSLIDIINAFNAEMPIIPICHPLGLTVSDTKFSADNISSFYDAYFGISNIR